MFHHWHAPKPFAKATLNPHDFPGLCPYPVAQRLSGLRHLVFIWQHICSVTTMGSSISYIYQARFLARWQPCQGRPYQSNGSKNAKFMAMNYMREQYINWKESQFWQKSNMIKASRTKSNRQIRRCVIEIQKKKNVVMHARRYSFAQAKKGFFAWPWT